ncbi:MAG: M23 family metallopeptidase [Bacteroidota bacterium]
MKTNICVTFWLVLMCGSHLFAQKQYPKKDFIAPINIIPSLSGNFGEIRPNHLHSGLDYKTEGKEGLPVFAAADGYIVRIKVSPYGYGKAIYINHPNGYTTVYAHLSEFNPIIAAYVKKAQYQKQSFEVELFPMRDELKVKQKDTLALSGNTGGSSGPHLHFEIRDTKTEFPINPILFGLPIRDKTPPSISGIAVYPIGKNTLINGKNKTLFVAVKNDKLAIDTLFISGKVGFGVETYDTEEMTGNKNGTYNVKLYKDTALVYEHKMESFSFDNTRYANAHIDYAQKKKDGRVYQRCFLMPNNQLEIYSKIDNNGIIEFGKDSVNRIIINAEDCFELKNLIYFFVKPNKTELPEEPDTTAADTLSNMFFPYYRASSFKAPNFTIEIPANALYENLNFTYKQTASQVFYSAIHKVHNPYTPLHKAVKINIVPNNLPLNLKEKAFVASVVGNKVNDYEGSTWNGNFLQASTKSFGNFAIAIDTIAPEIKRLVSKDTTKFEFKITDALTGISDYKALLNGKWVLMEYDAKTNRLIYFVDDYFNKEQNEFEIIVTDKVNNTKTEKFVVKK